MLCKGPGVRWVSWCHCPRWEASMRWTYSLKNKTTFKQEAKITSPSSRSEPYAECTQTLESHLTNMPFSLPLCVSKMTGAGPWKWGSWNILGRDLPKEGLPKGWNFSSRWANLWVMALCTWSWEVTGEPCGGPRDSTSAQERFCNSAIGSHAWSWTVTHLFIDSFTCSLIY